MEAASGITATRWDDTVATVKALLFERPPAEPAGRLVAGRYRLRSQLGRGSMGIVWLAQDEVLDRPVAVKQVIRAALFAAVEGRPPFSRVSVVATPAAVLEDAPGPFVHAGALRPVIEGLLAKLPDRRLTVEAARSALGAD
ncbi:hypothetical protein ACFVWG_33985 [Kribbella sp. NPDC058245]|uniref:hypothetical protein n=1 Tax=Kribbella sp. NPDC058245 TaxID=3346399 RepID=UPI0036E1ED27